MNSHTRLQRWAIVLSGMFCVSAIALNGWTWLGPHAWGPRIECAVGHFDFGDRQASELVDHEFVLENTGRKDLLIKDVLVDCSCVNTRVANTTIPPGYSLAVPVQITLKDQPNGRLKRQILVESNDPRNPRLVMTVTGRVFGQKKADAGQ